VDHVTGQLVELDGSPFPAGAGPVAIAVHPSERFVYVANVISNDVYVYARGAGGQLHRIGSPVRVGIHPFNLTLSPSGEFLYVSNQDDATLSAFKINVSGMLQQVPGSPFPTGLRPRGIAIDPSGRFAYIVNFGVNPYTSRDLACSGTYGSARGKGCTISVFAIEPHTGSLAEIEGSPVESDGTNPLWGVIDAAGAYLYITNVTSNDISVFQLDSTTGRIQRVPGSPFPAPGGPVSAALDWSDEFLYVVNSYAGVVTEFAVNNNSGHLDPVGTPQPPGLGPISIVAQR
jgi:6-phosphogluconolactonase (cycloisomerase 2 family)